MIQHLGEITDFVKSPDLITAASCLIFIIISMAVAFFTGKYTAGRFVIKRRRTVLIFEGFSFMASLVLLVTFGVTFPAIRGMLLCLIFLYASVSDIETRECDDYLHLMILLTGIIGTELEDIPMMMISGILVGLLILMFVVLFDSSLGGADIKFSAVCGFVLGLRRGLTGLMIGLLAAVLINGFGKSPEGVRRDIRQGFPLIPYLAAGCMAAYFM